MNTLKQLVKKIIFYKQLKKIKSNIKIIINKRRRINGNYQYSVVSAVYNTEKYLDDYFQSIVDQTLIFNKHIHLIMVDDGSTDSSAKIIKQWQQKYPENITYIKKENAGQASARNLGLKSVKTPWVTFIDPDDFVDIVYFEVVDKFLSSTNDVGMVSCNLMFYIEGTKKLKNHYLHYRFKKKAKIVNPTHMEGYIQTTVNSFFVKNALLTQYSIKFDDRIRPAYEDGHFVNQLLLADNRINIAFLKDPIYYYRKRSDGTSTLDTAWLKPERYTIALEFGLLDLFYKANKLQGHIPLYLQRYVLYHLSWYIKKIAFYNYSLEFLSSQQIKNFQKLLEELFSYIDSETIENCELGAIRHRYQVGLLAYYKSTRLDYQIYYIDDYDEKTNLISLHYYYTNKDESLFLLNGKHIELMSDEIKTYYLFNKTFVYEKKVQCKVEGNWGNFDVKLKNTETILSLNKKRYKNGIQVDILRSLLI